MADKKISALTAATSLTAAGPDQFVLVQSGATMNITAANLFKSVPVNAVVTEASELKTANGALSTTLAYSKLQSTATTGVTYTLAAGTHGTVKNIVCSAWVSGTMTVAVSGAINATTGAAGTLTITFGATQAAAVGRGVTLQNVDGVWYCVGNNGCTLS